MMQRRSLLLGALGATFALGQDKPSSPVRIAFLRASHAHGAAKIQIVRDNPLWELEGVWEPDPALAAKLRSSGIALLDRARLLADASIEVVAVESDVPDHAADALAALRAGKHVHVEKPPSTDLAGLRQLLDEAQARRRLLQQGYMWRSHPGIIAMLAAARQGWLGEVFQVRATIHTLVPAAERAAVGRYRGGQMFELGCHLIDPLIRLMGDPLRVTPTLQHRSGDALADNTVAIFEFPRALGIVQSAAVLPGASRQRSFEILGTNGSAVLRPIEPGVLQIDLKDAAGPYAAGAQTVALPAYRRYVADFDELAKAVRTGATLPVTAGEELRVQAAVLAASGMA
jgi:predicted dehydrogenase